MEERRLLLAVALSLLVLTAYSLLFSPPPAPGRRPRRCPRPPPATPPSARRRPATARRPRPRRRPPPRGARAAPSAVADPRERRVEVAAPDFTVAFTNRGARLVSWTLARHRDARGAPEEMVPARRRSAAARRRDGRPGGRRRSCATRCSCPRRRRSRSGRASPRSLRFDFAAGELEARKTLHVPARRGLVEVSVVVKRAGRELPAPPAVGPGHRQPDGRGARGAGLPGAGRRRAHGGGRRTPPGEAASPRPARASPAPAGRASRATTSRRSSWPPGAPLGASAALAERARAAATRSRTRFRSWRSTLSGGAPAPAVRGRQGLPVDGPARPRARAGGPGRGLDRPDRGAAHGAAALRARATSATGAGRSWCSRS